LISSNVERLLYELSGKNGFEVRTYMNQLASAGQYQVSATLAKALKEHFAAGYCDDEETKATISRTFQKGYLPIRIRQWHCLCWKSTAANQTMRRTR
jgi:threonine synthase